MRKKRTFGGRVRHTSADCSQQDNVIYCLCHMLVRHRESVFADENTHLSKRMAAFGLIAILFGLTVCSISATVIIWQTTIQVREALQRSDLV